MSHERQDIRDAIIEQLIGTAPFPAGYATAAQDRVTASRMLPNKTAQLPAISVYTDSESVDPASKLTAPRELKRTVTVAVDAWATATADIENTFDDLALEIETAMDSDLEFDETAHSSILVSTEIGLKMDGDRPMGCLHMEFAVTYHTDLRIAEEHEARDDFDTLGSQVSLGGTQDDEDDRAQDLVEDIHE